MRIPAKVDIAINVYGKPFQTALAIRSLIKYSGDHVGRIFIKLEKKQPFGFDENQLRDLLQDLDVVYYKPSLFLGWWQIQKRNWVNKLLFKIPMFRFSIRYQYPWEKTEANYLFLSHNDMVFHGDILANYLSKIENNIAIGHIGQCWNCPAHKTHCDGDRYWDYRPTMDELSKLYENWPVNRAIIWGLIQPGKASWPLPECRLNEHSALINMQIARKLTAPKGSFSPIGLMTMDIGIKWFQDAANAGYKVVHDSFFKYAKHGMFNEAGSGHGALFDENLYNREESLAKEMLESKTF